MEAPRRNETEAGPHRDGPSGLGDYNGTTPTSDSLAFIIYTRIVCVFFAGE